MDLHHANHVSFWRSRTGVALVVLGAVAGFFLLAEHRAHTLGVLPFLVVLACPLMHLFMHHGHGHRHSHGEDSSRNGPQEHKHVP